MSEDRETSGLSNVVRIDDDRIRDHLGQIVRHGRGDAQQPARGRAGAPPGRGHHRGLVGCWDPTTPHEWGTRVSPGTISNLNKKIYQQFEAWRNRPIQGEHPCVCLDGMVLKRSSAGEVRNVSLLVALGVSAEGYREILGICEGAKEDKAG